MGLIKDLLTHINSLNWTWSQVAVMIISLLLLALLLWTAIQLIKMPFMLRSMTQQNNILQKLLEEEKTANKKLQETADGQAAVNSGRIATLEREVASLTATENTAATVTPALQEIVPLLSETFKGHGVRIAEIEDRLAFLDGIDRVIGTKLLERLSEVPESVQQTLKTAQDTLLSKAVEAFARRHEEELTDLAARILNHLQGDQDPLVLPSKVRSHLEALLHEGADAQARAIAVINNRISSIPEDKFAEVDNLLIGIAEDLLGKTTSSVNPDAWEALKVILIGYLNANAVAVLEDNKDALSQEIVQVAQSLLGKDASTTDPEVEKEVKLGLIQYLTKYCVGVLEDGESDVDPEVVAVTLQLLGKDLDAADSEVEAKVKVGLISYLDEFGVKILVDNDSDVDPQIITVAKYQLGDDGNPIETEVARGVKAALVSYVDQHGVEVLTNSDDEIDPLLTGYATTLLGDDDNEIDPTVVRHVTTATLTLITERGEHILGNSESVQEAIASAAKKVLRSQQLDPASQLHQALTKATVSQVEKKE